MSEVYFNIAEKEIIEALRESFGITYMEACEKVIQQKKQAAFMYSQQGNFDLAEHLLREINEWNDEVARDFDNRGRNVVKDVKIILPGE